MFASKKVHGGKVGRVINRGWGVRQLWTKPRICLFLPGSLPGVECQVCPLSHFLHGCWGGHCVLSAEGYL